MESLHRIVGLIVRPQQEWTTIAAEKTSIVALLCRYILPLALLAPIATMIGMSTFDRGWDPLHGYLVPPERIFVTGATTYFVITGSILALAAVFAIIAPMFGVARDFVAAAKVATYGAVPVLLAGATLVFPVMAVVCLVALCHTFCLFWMGVRQVLHVPSESGAEFVAISLIILTLVSAIAGAIAGAIGLL